MFVFAFCTKAIPKRDVKTDEHTEPSSLCTVAPLIKMI